MSPFPRDKVDELLKDCHRRCCICHKFCGIKIETDHIIEKNEGGIDDIDNAIPVCFECHAEIHSYNVKHPRGRKFTAEELRLHKAQWLEICRDKPDIFVSALRYSDVGPLQALIDELEFNSKVASKRYQDQGCLFQDKQFKRAVQEGSIATLVDELKETVLDAYIAIGRANNYLMAIWNHAPGSSQFKESMNAAVPIVQERQRGQPLKLSMKH